MRWPLVAGLVVLIAAGAVMVVGWLLPVEHVARTRATIAAPRSEVWRALTDVSAFPQWRQEVEAVEMLPPDQGRLAWRERGRNGAIAYARVQELSEERLVSRITDESLPFGGTWTYELAEVPGGTQVTITEHGTVRNPFFRFMSRFVFGHHATQESFLESLAAKFGQDARPQRVP